MVKEKYTIICDDVRREDNGKLILLGIYLPDISVTQIPFVMPSLTFFQSLESDRPGNFSIKIKLQHLETGKILAEGMGMMAFNQPGMGINVLRLPNVAFIAAGAYNFVMEIQDQREPVIVPFNVILNVPTQTVTQR